MMNNTSIQLPKFLKLLAQTLPKLHSENKLNKEFGAQSRIVAEIKSKCQFSFPQPTRVLVKTT